MLRRKGGGGQGLSFRGSVLLRSAIAREVSCDGSRRIDEFTGRSEALERWIDTKIINQAISYCLSRVR